MRFVFDTNVLIDYLRDPNGIAVDALFRASDQGNKAFVSLISLLELYLPRKKPRAEVEKVKAIEDLCHRLGISIIFCSPTAQDRALEILKRHRASLGIELPDSLILGIGIARRSYLVTNEARKWSRISNRVISPEELVQRF